jgi:hypothetical protein
MKNTKIMLAVILTILLTWLLSGVLFSLVYDLGLRTILTSETIGWCMFIYGWIPPMVVGSELAEMYYDNNKK